MMAENDPLPTPADFDDQISALIDPWPIPLQLSEMDKAIKEAIRQFGMAFVLGGRLHSAYSAGVLNSQQAIQFEDMMRKLTELNAWVETTFRDAPGDKSSGK